MVTLPVLLVGTICFVVLIVAIISDKQEPANFIAPIPKCLYGVRYLEFTSNASGYDVKTYTAKINSKTRMPETCQN